MGDGAAEQASGDQQRLCVREVPLILPNGSILFTLLAVVVVLLEERGARARSVGEGLMLRRARPCTKELPKYIFK